MPCPQGHICERFVSYGQCVDCTVRSRDNWYANNKERARAKNVQWHIDNPGKRKARNAAWKSRNLEQVRAAIEAHRLANPEKYLQYRANRRARKRGAPGAGISAADIAALIKRQGGRCVYCRVKETLTLDHIVALANGGAHDPSNAQMICKRCNSSKGARDHIAFANTFGLLF